MKRFISFLIFSLFSINSFSIDSASARPQAARPEDRPQEIVAPDVAVGVGWEKEAPQKALADTVWIASWSFDGSVGHCTDAGWQKVDHYIRNDGSLYWTVGSGFGGTGGIAGKAAILGYSNNGCCIEPNGYDNDWYQAIRMQYSGSATLSFDYLLDSEQDFDFLEVETDSACASFALGNCAPGNPPLPPNSASCRDVVFRASGYAPAGHLQSQVLTDYGLGTHCVYISFFSDGGFSPCDGEQPTTLGRALVVDDIELTGGLPLTEDFEATVNPGIQFLNMQDAAAGFGQWGRVFFHITDNDVCTENASCAWLWTDYTTPTLYEPCPGPATCFGVNPLIDNGIISPWVSLASTPGASGTVLRSRIFGGSLSSASGIVANWSIRGRSVKQGQECISGWGGAAQWNSLGNFHWMTRSMDVTPFFDPAASEIAVRFRLAGWQLIAGADPPSPLIVQQGPYLDDVRIGRVVFAGPNISEGADARSQAQDAFPTEIDPAVTPAGEHYRPTTDHFGTTAFSPGTDLGAGRSPNLITGDSTWVQVTDARGAGGISSLAWYGAIVAGPHAGLAPAPWSVGPNGFFAVTPDSARNSSGAVIHGFYFVDLDDDYFRGGDELLYFWLATDALGGVASDPVGLTGVPASIAAAQQATGGLLEVSFLPQINWSPAYLARMRTADPGHGKVAPTAAELAASSQKGCVLYVNHFDARRRSGDVRRTSFMYTLDNLGYRGQYDVYDHTGMGSTNNHLGGRATIQQAQGYALIVYDAGNGTPGRPIMPNGANLETEKIDQSTWFRNWLAQAASPAVDFATLWLLGSNMVEEHSTNALYTSNCGVGLAATNQALHVNPDVAGQASFTFDKGSASSAVSFTTGQRAIFSLNGGCPEIRNYDGLSASGGSAVRVYRYKEPMSIFGGGGTLGAGAVVMNSNAAEDWNTILTSFPWFDIRDRFDPAPPLTPPAIPPPARDLMGAILAGVLPVACIRTPGPTDTPQDPALSSLPARTALHANVPNPFNPATTLRFDLARSGRVQLRIYDVAGRLVRTLLDQELKAGYQRSAAWNGLDDGGRRVSTGIYFCRLEAEGFGATRKMVLLQ